MAAMTIPARDAALVALLMAAAMAIDDLPAAAQAKRAGLPPGKAAPAGPVWNDCTQAAEPGHREAIGKASELLAAHWTATERGHFAAYTMEGEKRNPFDLTPKAPDSGPRDGLVQTRTPVCSWRDGERPGAILVRYTTPFYRFYETGPGWSAPLRNGLLLEAIVERVGDAWQARDAGTEQSILLPEQKPRRAEAAALPTDASWSEPMPGCGRRTKWNGEACVARKR